ncbi:MAG: FAD-dependent oxidoreductase [Neisseria sp.]|nr:FAD-dependent oxidoreductase [Neisseria sp.]
MKIAVLGGGLIGRLLAWRLADLPVQTALFERGTANGEQSAAYIAAAMLSPLAESIEATPQVIDLGKQSLNLWQEILPQLPRPVFFQQNGSLVVWHAQDGALFQQFQQHLYSATQTSGEMWQTQHIAQAEPQLAQRFRSALFLPQEAQLDNRQVLLTLADALSQKNVLCRWQTEHEATDLQDHFDWVIDCRGTGAKQQWHSADGSRLRGVRGEVARVYAPEITLNRPVRLLHPRYPLYIAPKENHVFVIGATQLESESTAPVSVRSGLELLSALYAVHPAFGEAQILELASNIRPTLHHHNPEIRFHKQKKLIEVNGLFRHGFMISPAVSAAAARLVQDLTQGNTPPDVDKETGLPFIEIT